MFNAMLQMDLVYVLLAFVWTPRVANADSLPIVITTWYFGLNPTNTAWDELQTPGKLPLDAVQKGCEWCEDNFCSSGVGYGYKPDESGESTLDALVMDGKTHDVGAVGGLRRVQNAIGVARAVMKHTSHTLIVGDAATEFAKSMGFEVMPNASLSNTSDNTYWTWRQNDCQPNFRKNVKPAGKCGPYYPADQPSDFNRRTSFNKRDTREDASKIWDVPGSPSDHDTICVIAIGANKDAAVGVTTNGLRFKVPGRVGDSPIPGAGGYVDNEVGGAAATGNGDIMMRFLPSYHAVELMRHGVSPERAGQDAIRRILKHYPDFNGAMIVVNNKGEYGAACSPGYKTFPYFVRTGDMTNATRVDINCTIPDEPVFPTTTPVSNTPAGTTVTSSATSTSYRHVLCSKTFQWAILVILGGVYCFK
ncbi:unnamed protein product [Owenia fusiformis]|uniref:N(4)-(beta-N-acetylglucosaminyl)-L-asparaginase n=1 Tax=Owenia fusiformis TaxID=6347 RepID=A0A8J1TEA3_OWEFU|nr:unnamed protein product [Owenia fusiformis]